MPWLRRDSFVLPGDRCAVFGQILADYLKRQQRLGHLIAPDVLAEIDEMSAVGRAWWIAESGKNGATESTARVDSVIVSSMTTDDVATETGERPRTIRNHAGREPLEGRRTSAGWLFDEPNVAAWAATRRRAS